MTVGVIGRAGGAGARAAAGARHTGERRVAAMGPEFSARKSNELAARAAEVSARGGDGSLREEEGAVPTAVQEPMPGAASTAPESQAQGPSPAGVDGGGSGGRFGVMRHRHYRNVLLAQFVSNCGNWMEMVGLQMYVATMTGSLKWLGYLGAAQLTPILLLGTFGGLVADRTDRRRLLVMTQAGLMVAAALVAAVSMIDWPKESMTPVYLLCVLGAVQGVVMAFNMPAWQVLTPRLVPKDELLAAITYNGIQFNLARVVGPALAGLIMGWVGVIPLFVLNTLSFLVVVLTVRTTPPNPPPASNGASAWVQIMEAARFMAVHRGVRAVFMAQVVMSMLAAPLVRLLSLFIIDVYGQGDDQADRTMGWMLAVQGVGAVTGGVTLRVLPTWYPKHHLIPVAVLANGLFISLFALATNPLAGFAVMFFVGFFWIWAFNQSWAAMQHLTPDAMRGRVMALTVVASFGSTAVGTLLAGWAGEGLDGTTLPLIGAVTKAASTQGALMVLSVPLLVAGVVMLVFRAPEVDGLPRGRVNLSRRLDVVNAVMAREHRP